jgi:hypothetical protein
MWLNIEGRYFRSAQLKFTNAFYVQVVYLVMFGVSDIEEALHVLHRVTVHRFQVLGRVPHSDDFLGDVG